MANIDISFAMDCHKSLFVQMRLGKKRKAGQEPKPLPCLVGLREDFQLSYHLVVVPSGLAILLTDGCGEVASEVDYELV